MKLILLAFFCCLSVTLCHKMSKVAFVIMSQPHRRHAAIAEETRSKLIAGLKEHGVEEPTVLTSHKDLPPHGAWTYFPLFDGVESITLNNFVNDKNYMDWQDFLVTYKIMTKAVFF